MAGPVTRGNFRQAIGVVLENGHGSPRFHGASLVDLPKHIWTFDQQRLLPLIKIKIKKLTQLDITEQ